MIHTQRAHEAKQARSLKPSSKSICKVIIPKNSTLRRKLSQAELKPRDHKASLVQALKANQLDSQPPEKQQTTKQWIDSQRSNLVSAHSYDQQKEQSQDSRYPLNYHNKPDSTVHPTRLTRHTGEFQREIDRPAASSTSESTLEYVQESIPASSPNHNQIPSFLDLSPTKSPPNHAGLDSPTSNHSLHQFTASAQHQLNNEISISSNLKNIQIPRKTGSASNTVRLKFKQQGGTGRCPTRPENRDLLIPPRTSRMDSKALDQIDPFGFLQAEGQIERHMATQQTAHENTCRESKILVLPDLQSKHQATHRSHLSTSHQVQKDQAHQESDLSLADLLNIRKNRNRLNSQVGRHYAKRSKSRIPKIELLSSPSSGQIHIRRNRTKNRPKTLNGKRNKVVENKENLDREQYLSRSLVTDNQSPIIQTPRKMGESNFDRRHRGAKVDNVEKSFGNRGINGTVENGKDLTPQPRVLIPKKNLHNSSQRHLKGSMSKKNRAQSDFTNDKKSTKKNKYSKSRSISSPQTNPEEHQEAKKDSTPPDRRARLNYYKELDQLELEEEVVIDI